jgi:hypothetical protein
MFKISGMSLVTALIERSVLRILDMGLRRSSLAWRHDNRSLRSGRLLDVS